LRPPFAATFFAPAVALFFMATALVPLVGRVDDLPFAVALVAEAVFFVCAAPRVLRDGALFSLLDSGVGCALSSSTVISSSEADSTVKEIFAALLRGAILFCRESLVRAGSWVCGGMGAGVACKHTTLASLPNTALLPPKTQPDLHQQGQCCAWRNLA
jgi:hypothetical protein